MARKRGRPPLKSGEKTVPVTQRLPESEYDYVWHIAHRDGISVPEVLRRGGWKADRSLADRVRALEAKLNPPSNPIWEGLSKLVSKKVSELNAA